MWAFLKDKFWEFIASFRDSETIWWARIQTVLGLVAGALIMIDPMMVPGLSPTAVVVWMIFNGIVSEVLRRNREDWKDQ
jgi:uncharacterized membrane protein HdeD (DUF308 family)